MRAIEQIKELIKELLHECSEESVESKTVQHYNGDPNVIQSPYSIYGPEGSYWAMLRHCKVCDRYGGKKYDTFGGRSLAPSEAQSEWEKDEAKKATV